MGKKKVLFIISGLAYSGAEKVLEDYIDKTDVIIPYFLFYFDGDAYECFKNKYPNVLLSKLKYSKTKLKFVPFTYFNKVNKEISVIKEQNKIQKVFFNNTPEGMLGYKYIKNNRDCFYEIHDMKCTFKFFLKRMIIEKAINNCANTITVSQACKKSWNDIIKHVVYNGININFDNIEDKSNIVTYIGNSSYRKGSDICLEVARYFYATNSKVKFYMIFGDKIPNYEFPKNVIQLCKIERKQINEILKMSKILFLPTRNDPFPTVILEGEQNSNIIVANNVDGVPEMVPDNEFLSSSNSIDDYIAYINKIINMDKSEFERIVHLQNSHIKKFDIEKKVKIFDRILSED